MSWNLIILPPDDAGDDADLGDASEVRSRLGRVLTPIDWSEPSTGLFFGPGYRVEIGLQERGTVESFMLHVTGDGDPLPLVVRLARSNGWAVFDSVAGDYLDLDHPSDAGWKGYHAHVAGKVVPPDEA